MAQREPVTRHRTEALAPHNGGNLGRRANGSVTNYLTFPALVASLALAHRRLLGVQLQLQHCSLCCLAFSPSFSHPSLVPFAVFT